MKIKIRKSEEKIIRRRNQKAIFNSLFWVISALKIDITSIGAMRNKLLNFGGTDGTHLYVKKQKCPKLYPSKTRINGIANNFKIYDCR